MALNVFGIAALIVLGFSVGLSIWNNARVIKRDSELIETIKKLDEEED